MQLPMLQLYLHEHHDEAGELTLVFYLKSYVGHIIWTL